MWWHEERRGVGRRRCAAVVMLAFGLAMGACGFRPLHKPAPTAEVEPNDRLAQVRIKPLRDRVGQQLHNLMRDRINPAGPPAKPRYDLAIRVTSQIQRTGIQVDETATRANLLLRASYELRIRETDELLVRGRADSFTSYNILGAFYATTISEQAALKRGLREIADELALRLAIYFADPGAVAATPVTPDPDPGPLKIYPDPLDSKPGSSEDPPDEIDPGPVDPSTE